MELETSKEKGKVQIKSACHGIRLYATTLKQNFGAQVLVCCGITVWVPRHRSREELSNKHWYVTTSLFGSHSIQRISRVFKPYIVAILLHWITCYGILQIANFNPFLGLISQNTI